MTQHATAVFENGHLTPLTPLQGIPEHAIVEIAVRWAAPVSDREQMAALLDVPTDLHLADAIEAGRGTLWPVDEF